MSDTNQKTRMRDVLSRGFFLNYACILLLTCWIPLVTQTAIAKDEKGKVLSATTKQVRVYRSYGNVVRGAVGRDSDAATTAGPMDADVMAVLLHLGLCFAISYAVWYAVLRLGPRRPVEEAAPGEDPA